MIGWRDSFGWHHRVQTQRYRGGPLYPPYEFVRIVDWQRLDTSKIEAFPLFIFRRRTIQQRRQ